jgi:hypothetical protein
MTASLRECITKTKKERRRERRRRGVEDLIGEIVRLLRLFFFFLMRRDWGLLVGQGVSYSPSFGGGA